VSSLPIEEHGIIGDLRSVALVGTDGAIDWCCAPRVDSPSVFAALLDDERGGTWQISPRLDALQSRQMYLPDTNVLITLDISRLTLGNFDAEACRELLRSPSSSRFP
jgi:GH15 family glucan-1,4-alpha-glucosidase